jgi:hypothetical protein
MQGSASVNVFLPILIVVFLGLALIGTTVGIFIHYNHQTPSLRNSNPDYTFLVV